MFHELADGAYFRNVILVSAANGVNVASYPSLFSSVVSVAAHAEPDPWRLYYNPNPPVEFGGVGVDVPIAWKDGTETVATGNSFAALPRGRDSPHPVQAPGPDAIRAEGGADRRRR